MELVALTVCTPTWLPGVNRPFELIVPTEALPLATPSTVQVTV
jgi:hypothetical protein